MDMKTKSALLIVIYAIIMAPVSIVGFTQGIFMYRSFISKLWTPTCSVRHSEVRSAQVSQ